MSDSFIKRRTELILFKFEEENDRAYEMLFSAAYSTGFIHNPEVFEPQYEEIKLEEPINAVVEATTEVMPEIIPEVVIKDEAEPMEVAPETAPEAAPEAEPMDVAPEIAPVPEAEPMDVAPEVAPEVKMEVAPEVAPEVKTEAEPEVKTDIGEWGLVTKKGYRKLADTIKGSGPNPMVAYKPRELNSGKRNLPTVYTGKDLSSIEMTTQSNNNIALSTQNGGKVIITELLMIPDRYIIEGKLPIGFEWSKQGKKLYWYSKLRFWELLEMDAPDIVQDLLSKINCKEKILSMLPRHINAMNGNFESNTFARIVNSAGEPIFIGAMERKVSGGFPHVDEIPLCREEKSVIERHVNKKNITCVGCLFANKYIDAVLDIEDDIVRLRKKN
jgi:hypothetical protein